MARIPLGTILDPSEDIFPSNAPHLHVEVLKNNQRVDPAFARSFLQNVRYGKQGIPIVQQVGNDWKWNLERTSEFGPRNIGVKDASTDHRGLDLASSTLVPGTELAYHGPGKFEARQGYGALLTSDASGTPYELRFLHTRPAAPSQVQAPESGQTPPFNSPTSSSRESDILKAYIYGLQSQEEKKPEKSMKQQLKEQVVGGLISQAMNPMGFLSSFASSDPLLGGQAAATNDYLMGMFG